MFSKHKEHFFNHKITCKFLFLLDLTQTFFFITYYQYNILCVLTLVKNFYYIIFDIIKVCLVFLMNFIINIIHDLNIALNLYLKN